MMRANPSNIREVSVRHRLTISALLLIACGASGVAAQNATPATAQPLSRAAFIATMDAEYRKLDSNRDQTVTRTEIDANLRARQAASVAQRTRALFAQIDGDRNGQLSIDEFIRANAPTGAVDGGAIMSRLDANRDQKVTLVEYRILTLANFDRIDSDRDGVITPAEQRATTTAR